MQKTCRKPLSSPVSFAVSYKKTQRLGLQGLKPLLWGLLVTQEGFGHPALPH